MPHSISLITTIAASLGFALIFGFIAARYRELVEKLRKRGMLAVSGNSSDPAVLIQAHIARAHIFSDRYSGFVSCTTNH